MIYVGSSAAFQLQWPIHPTSESISKQQAIVGDHRCPVAGRPSMDLLPIDITDLSDPTAARLGQMVTLIGSGITIDEFKSSGREVLSHLGSRFHRIYYAV